jgi:hypothetical protein
VQQHAHAGLAQDVLQLAGQVGGVDVDQDGADAGAGVLDDDPLVTVAGPDADALSRPNSQGEKAASQAGRLVP